MEDDLQRLLPASVRLTHTRHGLMLYPAGDTFIGPCLEAYGEYCPEEARVFQQLVRPGDVVAEVGANIGAHTVLLSRLAGPGGLVYAFEPQPLVFQMLCANLALNDVSNVDARRLGLGARMQALRVSPPASGAVANFGGVSLGADGPVSVDVVALDSLALPRLDFVKIDVEGMEEGVILGGIETIRRLRPKLYVENDSAAAMDGAGTQRPEMSRSLIRLIRGLGYRLWWHAPPLFQPANFRGNTHNIFPKYVVSLNMLCIRDDEKVSTNFREILDDSEAYQL
jgi:FkbM family methyltransferase